MNNLDILCAETGFKIVDSIKNNADKNKIESFITKSMGVLQENGVYAFFLFLAASKEKNISDTIKASCMEFLKSKEIRLISSEDVLKAVREELSQDIDDIILAKELLEKTMIYARYHAKALA